MEKATVQSLMRPGKGLSLKSSIIIKLVLVLIILTQESYSQGKLMGKLIAKVGSKVGNANVLSTATLDDILPTVGIGSNLHPTELGTISQAFFKDWTTGGQQVFIGFSKKNSPSFYKIDGSVKFNGMEIEYVTSGMYSIIGGTSNLPRKVDIVTSSGQKSSFTITPTNKPIKLVSINGSTKDNVELDLSKDVTLEVEGLSDTDKQLVKISLAINQVGIKSIYDVCFIRAGAKLTIPAAAFRNINILPGGNALYNYKKSFLSVGVESVENATQVTGSIPSVKYTSSYSDGKFVTVATEPKLNAGLTIKGTEDRMDYTYFKPNAFLSRPLSQLKKLGVISFSIRGTTAISTSSSATFTVASSIPGYVQDLKRTTITTYQFPQQTNEVWDALLEKLYPQLLEVVKSEVGCNDIPVDQITSCDAYRFTQSFAKDDENTKIEFARSFRDTKVLSAFLPLTEGYGLNNVNQQIMNETGTDALMTMTLDLQIALGPNKEILMVPKFAFEIVGKSNGPLASTKYCTGTISSTTGVEVPIDVTPDELELFVRKSVLLPLFRKGLKEIMVQEKANSDYETVWNLQK